MYKEKIEKKGILKILNFLQSWVRNKLKIYEIYEKLTSPATWNIFHLPLKFTWAAILRIKEITKLKKSKGDWNVYLREGGWTIEVADH